MTPSPWSGPHTVGAGAAASSRTVAVKSSPRASYDSYESKDAQAGDSSTASPGRASPAAAETASPIDEAVATS